MEMALKFLPDTATITLGFDGEQELHLPTEAKARTTVRALPDSPEEWYRPLMVLMTWYWLTIRVISLVALSKL